MPRPLLQRRATLTTQQKISEKHQAPVVAPCKLRRRVRSRKGGSPPPAGVISQLHSLLFKPTSGLVHTSTNFTHASALQIPSPPVKHVPFDTRHTRDHGQGRPARSDTRPLEPAARGEEGSALLAHFCLDMRIGVLVCVRVCESPCRSCSLCVAG